MKTNEEMIEGLRRIVSIESVANLGESEKYPYGKGPAKAMEETLRLCEELGIHTTNRDGIVAFAEVGEGEEMVAILGHLDVVPPGEGWKYPIYDITEVDGRLYGRGVTDDKGPLVACLYAIHDLLESGHAFKRRLRVIFGQCEEVGDWEDIAYYKEHEEMPIYGFTPDADFPAIYGEKGLLGFRLTIPMKQTAIKEIAGGDARNMVAGWCKAKVAGKSYETEGKAAHASLPDDGKNAISMMMEELAGVIPEDPVVAFYQEHLGFAVHGEKMPCALEDEQSGRLTMNVGVIKVEAGNLVMDIDVRNPVTYTVTDVLEPIKAAAEPVGFTVENIADTAPIYMDKNGPVIQKLVSVYREVTGDQSEPAVIGGGTYARSMDNIVAFGPMIPGRELTEHQPNEYILKEDFFLLREIYRKAIAEIVNI